MQYTLAYNMETLQRIRPNTKIITFDLPDKSYIVRLLELLTVLHKNDNIVVVTDYSGKHVDDVIDQIDPNLWGRVFFGSELSMDPINNCMVPTHRLATEDEIDELKRKNINLDTIPVLSMRDPIRRWYNFSLSSIVAIERNCPSDIYFRQVR